MFMGVAGKILEDKNIPIQLFVHDFSKKGTLEIFAYEIGGMLMIIILIYWLYTRYSFRDWIIKLLLLSGIVLGLKEIGDIAIFNNRNNDTLFYEIGSYFLCVLFLLYKVNTWTIKLKGNERYQIKDNGIYAVFRPGIGISHLSIITKQNGTTLKWGMKYGMGRLSPEKLKEGHVVKNRLVKKLPIENKDIREFLDGLLNISENKSIKWTPVKNNCLTMVKPLYEKYGIKVNTWNPAIWAKSLDKNELLVRSEGIEN